MTATTTRRPARWTAFALPLAAALLSNLAQASVLVQARHASYSAYSYAHVWQGDINRALEGPFEKGNSCDCGILNSFGLATSGYNNAAAEAAFDSADQFGTLAMASGSVVVGASDTMRVYGQQTDDEGQVSFKGQVYLQSAGSAILEASHVGSKPNWMYEFLALDDVTFSFDYRYVLGGTPMPPELWVDGVSSLTPGLRTGTYLAQFQAGSVHRIELQNTLALFHLGMPGYLEHAEMDFEARWTIAAAPSNPDPHTVPEPPSLALAALALLAAWRSAHLQALAAVKSVTRILPLMMSARAASTRFFMSAVTSLALCSSSA
jgi:hypothetical protein